MDRSISVERNLRVDFEAGAAALREQAADVVLDDAAERTLVLHAEVGGFDVAREVTVTLGELTQVEPHVVTVPVQWEAVDRPKRFPTFEGALELSSLSEHPAQSQLALVGHVHAPMGVLGKVGEAAGGTQLGDAVLESLVERLTARLQALVAERQASKAAQLPPSHLSRPRFVEDD